MIRYLYVFSCLVASLGATQAQPLIARNTLSHSTDLATPENGPEMAKVSESPVYIKVYGFYGLLTPGSQITSSYTSNSAGTSTAFKTNKKGLGAGPRAGVGIGIIVNDFINLGIDADMLFGAAIKTDNAYRGSNYIYTNTSSTTLRVLSFTPNITFKALSRPAYYIYNRLGVVVGTVLDYKIVENSENVPNAGIITLGESITEYTKNSLAVGYQAALGIQFRLSENLRGFAEIVAYNQSFKPRELLGTSVHTTNGALVNDYTYITEYKDQGEYVSSTRDGVEVNQAASYNVAMNSIGVGAGILFRF